MALKTIEEHDAARWSFVQEPVMTGVECPTCGHELENTNPNVTLTTNPPQIRVHCPDCHWSGTILA